MNTSKEWADATFERATWWNLHPDKCPNDFGVTTTHVQKLEGADELETIAEWEKMQDAETDLINPIY